MAHMSASRSLLGLAKRFKKLNFSDPLTQCLTPRLNRHFASQTGLLLPETAKAIETNVSPSTSAPLETSESLERGISTNAQPTLYTLDSPILATLHSWPDLEPSRYAMYGSQYLDAPLRRDILHRAVIYEADATRQGTASTKWRFEVRGSNRKLYQQKGTGRARVRDKKSPIRRGGGVAFGPKPRDFSTELQRRVYDQAFKIALSYRFRRGELIILDEGIDLPEGNSGRFLNNIFEGHQWGRGNGRSLLVTSTPEAEDPRLFKEMRSIGEHGMLKDLEDVDVKDLLETGRVVIEREALFMLFLKHSKSLEGKKRSSAQSEIVRYL